MAEHSEYINRLIEEMISRNHWKKMVTNEILTTPEANLLYSSVSKCACTQIKFILADLVRYPERMDRSLAPYNPANSGLVPVALMEDRDEVYRLFFGNDVFRFAFVRNPLTRLASAYINKLKFNFYTAWEKEKREQLETRYSNQVQDIKKNISGITPETLDLARHPLTFREFIYYVYEQEPYAMDRHWYHQNRAMFHDILDYRFIGKVENFNEDIRHVLESINAPAGLYNFEEKQNAANINYRLEDYFDSELERLAVKKFEEDFDLFEYPKYQVRPFQSAYVKQPEEPVTYSGKMNSLEEPDIARSVGVVLTTDDLSADALKRVIDIRKRTAEDVPIYMGARETGKPGSDLFHSLGNINIVDIENQAVPEAYNLLIRMVKEPYILILEKDALPDEGFHLPSALKIFGLNDSVRIVGGMTDVKNARADNGYSGTNPVQSQKIILLKDYRQLILTPVAIFDGPRYYIDEFDYGFCDTAVGAMLMDKNVFLEENLWFDEGIHDLRLALVDLFLRIFLEDKMKVVESSSLKITVDGPEGLGPYVDAGAIPADITFFNKWNLLRFTWFGQYIMEFNRERELAYEYPFTLLDSLGNAKENEKQVIKHKILNAAIEGEIERLEKSLHSLKTSRSWKMTAPFRKIVGRISGERGKP